MSYLVFNSVADLNIYGKHPLTTTTISYRFITFLLVILLLQYQSETMNYKFHFLGM